MSNKNPNKKVNILCVFAFFYPHRGGSQKYGEELFARLVKEYPNVSVDILAYNTDGVEDYEEYRGMRIYRIPCFNIIYSRFALPNPYYLIKALYKLSKNNYDYVNTHIRFFDPTWWVWIYAKLIGAKSIFTGHVASHPNHENPLIQFISRFIDNTIAKVSLKFYDYLTFTNKEAVNFFKKKLGVNKRQYLVYGGVDTKFFSPKHNQGRVIPKIGKEMKEDDLLVTFVGRVTWTKGVTYLFESIKQIYKEYKNNNLYFVIAGPGDLVKNLRKKVREDGLEERVFLPGNLNYKQVRDLLAASDIFINPSHHNEGFPNTILEAGASGCYVIATDNAGTKEIVTKKTGKLVEQKNSKQYKNSILEALNNKNLMESKSIEMRKLIVKDHDWSVIANEFYELINN